MKTIAMILISLLTTTAFADMTQKGDYLYVTDQDALKSQQINQYADEEHPPQGYVVTLPAGYELRATDVDSGGASICGVSAYDYKNQTIKIDGFYIETDAATCVVKLTIYSKKDKKNVAVEYAIEQTGT